MSDDEEIGRLLRQASEKINEIRLTQIPRWQKPNRVPSYQPRWQKPNDLEGNDDR